MAKRATKKTTSVLGAVRTWQILAATLSVLLAGVSIWSAANMQKTSTDPQKIAEDMISFINLHLLQGQTATLLGAGEVHGVIQINLSIGGSPYTSYVTKDGALLFVSGIDVNKLQASAPQKQAPTPSVPKSDRPVVELFVMSYCPYGTQMEKGLLPVLDTLGDKIDFQLKFVNYAMHGEKEVRENVYQYCIQKEFPDKLVPYLYCFLKDGDRNSCVQEVGIDSNKLEQCFNETDEKFGIMAAYNDRSTWSGGRYPPFSIYNDENARYGVRGSPTLVINGQQVSTPRDSASLLSTICAAFDNPPEECNTQLSSASPSPGFGFSTTTSGSTASCG